MNGVTIKPTQFVPAGQILVMADYSHPETPMFEFEMVAGSLTARPAETPDGRVIACNPADVPVVRDAIARCQETPQWWLDWQAFERAVQRALGEYPCFG